ncbi:MAG: type II toxin-antitoxin system HicB family antitoxin [Chloroflexi bacterium]|nr:type II toxin-antitoxin system HicB family antitoxin [Chloroflexota bacterium]
MAQAYRVPIVVEAQPEGGYAVRSPALPELITEGDTLQEAVEHAQDAVMAVLELYEDLGKPLPEAIRQELGEQAIQFELFAATA